MYCTLFEKREQTLKMKETNGGTISTTLNGTDSYVCGTCKKQQQKKDEKFLMF